MLCSKIGNKIWCKCGCCALMETSIGRCLLPRYFWDLQAKVFTCFNFCRSDPHFALWYFRPENFVRYLISTQCLPFENQKKSFLSLLRTSQIRFFVTHFTLLIRSFSLREMVFCERIFSKKHPILFRRSVSLLKSNTYCQSCQKYPFTGAQEPFKWWQTLWDPFS